MIKFYHKLSANQRTILHNQVRRKLNPIAPYFDSHYLVCTMYQFSALLAQYL